jgi:large subunit ribosomal protein L13
VLGDTYMAKPGEIPDKWYVVDAEGQILGRLAAQVAKVLRGKHRPTFTPSVDTGEHVIVVNAAKIRVSGDKLASKRYYRHSGYPGGLKVRTLQELLEERPERVVELAVRGMLPKNRLGRELFRKLKVYAGPDHPHAAQKPEPLSFERRSGS